MAETAFKRKLNEYWQNRAENNFLAGEKDALQVAKELKTNYDSAYREIENQINIFYGKYATETGLDLEAAKQLLDKNELKDFKSYIKAMLKMGDKNNFSSAEMFEFKRLYNKAKITRLEELQANIRGELDKLAHTTELQVGDLLEEQYEDNYYKTIYDTQMQLGTDRAFSSLNKQAVEKAVKEKYLQGNYSSRIWANTSNVLNKLVTQDIPRGIALGYNPRKLARETVKKRMDKQLYNNTVRLIRTEYSHILNQATLDGYSQAGISQYKILTTLDSRRCDDCGEFEGKIVDIDKAIEGIDLPPFHPNCRCTTIPYFPPDEIDEMSDEELSQIGFITYDDWKDGLVKLENGKVKYSSKAKIEGGD